MLWNDRRTPDGQLTDSSTGRPAKPTWGGKPMPSDFHSVSANEAASNAGHRVGVAKPVGVQSKWRVPGRSSSLIPGRRLV